MVASWEHVVTSGFTYKDDSLKDVTLKSSKALEAADKAAAAAWAKDDANYAHLVTNVKSEANVKATMEKYAAIIAPYEYAGGYIQDECNKKTSDCKLNI